jgi:hypothetical protein
MNASTRPDPRPVITLPRAREDCLRLASEIVGGDWMAEDGARPTTTFARIAALWSVVLDVRVTPAQVALCMIQLKVARLSGGNVHHGDSIVDIAGYAACLYGLPEET